MIRQCTYIAGNVCVSTSSENRNGIALDLKLLCFGFLPVVLVTILQGEYLPPHTKKILKIKTIISETSETNKNQQRLTSLRLKALTLDWMKKG